jgi:hypothetical protein
MLVKAGKSRITTRDRMGVRVTGDVDPTTRLNRLSRARPASLQSSIIVCVGWVEIRVQRPFSMVMRIIGTGPGNVVVVGIIGCCVASIPVRM